MEEMLIRISPRSYSVQIETRNGNRKTIKNTTIEAIREALNKDFQFETPLLPGLWGVQKYAKFNGVEVYAITEPPRFTKVKYDMQNDDEEVFEFDIPLPPLLWIFLIQVESEEERYWLKGSVFALKRPILTMEDPLYQFPFTNVDDSGDMCWGRNYLNLTHSKSIQSLPTRFMSAPFNMDFEDEHFYPFTVDEGDEEIEIATTLDLFRYLHDQSQQDLKTGKTPEFPLDILKPAGETFKSVFNYFMNGGDE